MSQNTAYDFDRFMPQTKPQTPPNDNVVRLPVKKQKQKPQRGRMVRVVAICAVCFMLFGAVIYNEMTINELNTGIQSASTKLDHSQNEYIQLQMAAQSRITLDEVEKYAVNVLGMQKLQNSQIEYIRMNDQDKVEAAPAADPGLWGQIRAWFSRIFS